MLTGASAARRIRTCNTRILSPVPLPSWATAALVVPNGSCRIRTCKAMIALRNSRPAPRTSGVRASNSFVPPVDDRHGSCGIRTHTAGRPRGAAGGLPAFKAGAPRRWGQSFLATTDDGGNRTRVTGFADRCLATRPRRRAGSRSRSHPERKLKESNLHGTSLRLPAFQAGAPRHWGQSFRVTRSGWSRIRTCKAQ